MKNLSTVLTFLVWAMVSTASPIPKNSEINITSDIKNTNIDVPVTSDDEDINDIFEKREDDIIDSIFDLSSESEIPDDETEIPYYGSESE